MARKQAAGKEEMILAHVERRGICEVKGRLGFYQHRRDEV
jgi:hypothetical protein